MAQPSKLTETQRELIKELFDAPVWSVVVSIYRQYAEQLVSQILARARSDEKATLFAGKLDGVGEFFAMLSKEAGLPISDELKKLFRRA